MFSEKPQADLNIAVVVDEEILRFQVSVDKV